MTGPFGGAWWSIELPEEWSADQDEDCATIISPDEIGALQVSAFKNEDADVTEDDLRAFAEDRLDPASDPVAVTAGTFDGLYTEYTETDEEGESWWREWVLRCGRILIYATYCCDAKDKAREDPDIDAILESLCAHEDDDGESMPEEDDA